MSFSPSNRHLIVSLLFLLVLSLSKVTFMIAKGRSIMGLLEVGEGQGHQGAREGAVRAHIMRQFKFLLQHSPRTNISQLPYSQLLTQEAMISPITSPCVGNASVAT
ncbi:hypothetical protein V6N11_081580 [Hibiscus sabdariffa]|uniref:Uncharacterized protein n=1 Tax=Hibiscus sabdariffa TaxID=183260 RepID=A0ABR1ZLB9_9ROSI